MTSVPVEAWSSLADPTPFNELVEHATAEVAAGRIPSAQFAVARDGVVMALASVGAPPEAHYLIWSAAKAFLSGLAGVMLRSGELALDSLVHQLVPELDRDGGWRELTIEHLLLHTAGFPDAPMRPEEGADPTQRRARFRDWRLDSRPGEVGQYHATSAAWVLSDLMERTTGVRTPDLLRDRVLVPLGLSRTGLGPHATALSPRRIVSVGEPPPVQVVEGLLERGVDIRPALAAFAEEIVLRFNQAAVLDAGTPAGGTVSTAEDIVTYYQHLLHDPLDLWGPTWLQALTAEVRNTLPDRVIGTPMNRTIGFVVTGDGPDAAMRDNGASTGPRTFGQRGIGGQITWADPDTGISFAWLTDGMDRNVLQVWQRAHQVNEIAAALR